MIDSEHMTLSAGPTELAIPPGPDQRLGYSLMIQHFNDGETLMVGGPIRQQWSVQSASAFPLNTLDPDEVVWVNSPRDGFAIEVFWQGVAWRQ